jgi:hypothetical protein
MSGSFAIVSCLQVAGCLAGLILKLTDQVLYWLGNAAGKLPVGQVFPTDRV